jgi:hypothetical protein
MFLILVFLCFLLLLCEMFWLGLGKTAQVAAHFNSLGLLSKKELHLRQSMIFLIVCPATIMQHWLKEMHHFAPKIRSCVFHSISSTGKALNSLSKKGLFLFSHYLKIVTLSLLLVPSLSFLLLLSFLISIGASLSYASEG